MPPASNSQPQGNNKAKLAIAIIFAIAILAGGAAIYAKNLSKSSADTAGTGDTTATTITQSSSSGLRDGSYSASGSYSTPQTRETIDVTLTIKGGVVTDSTVSQVPQDPESKQYQRDFATNYKPLVVGKKITDIKLSHVSGSSLTSEGFNSAVENIIKQAEQA
jgi:uncharacterized protein with FMN-binding domain